MSLIPFWKANFWFLSEKQTFLSKLLHRWCWQTLWVQKCESTHYKNCIFCGQYWKTLRLWQMWLRDCVSYLAFQLDTFTCDPNLIQFNQLVWLETNVILLNLSVFTFILRHHKHTQRTQYLICLLVFLLFWCYYAPIVTIVHVFLKKQVNSIPEQVQTQVWFG